MTEYFQDDSLDRLLSQLEASSAEAGEQSNSVTFADLERQDKQLDLRLKETQVKSQEQDREQRGKFAKMIFWVVVGYLAVVLLIVILGGAKVLFTTDTVLITLLGTTTANVISLLVIVAKYLFHSKE
jgi:hypothetical protein